MEGDELVSTFMNDITYTPKVVIEELANYENFLEVPFDHSDWISGPLSVPIELNSTESAFTVMPLTQPPSSEEIIHDNHGSLVSSVSSAYKTVGFQQPEEDNGVIESSVYGGGTCDEKNTTAHEYQIPTGKGSVIDFTQLADFEIFPIRCKKTFAKLHRSKFGSGHRGRCIEYNNKWYTPTEFERISGNAASKVWKRSIKFAKYPLLTLINHGILKPHALVCSCSICHDDKTSFRSVHLIKPNNIEKNRKKYQIQRKKIADADLKNLTELEILQISCKSTKAELHKCKLGSGRRGRCIKYNNEWYTPHQFEGMCGNAASRAWKRSITVDGYRLQTAIDQGILKPHSTICECAICSDGADASSPVLFFQRNKPREKKNARLEKESQSTSDGKIYSFATYEATTNDVMNNDSFLEQTSSYADIEDLQKEYDAAAVDTSEISPRCANCDREAVSVCHFCPLTWYCSPSCEREDWPVHSEICTGYLTEDLLL